MESGKAVLMALRSVSAGGTPTTARVVAFCDTGRRYQLGIFTSNSEGHGARQVEQWLSATLALRSTLKGVSSGRRKLDQEWAELGIQHEWPASTSSNSRSTDQTGRPA